MRISRCALVLPLCAYVLGACDAVRDPAAETAGEAATPTTTLSASDVQVAVTAGPSKIGMAGWGKAIAFGDDAMHTVWKDGATIMYARSTDGGTRWTQQALAQCPTVIIPFAGPFVRIAAAGRDVYVSWYCSVSVDHPALFLFQSHDDGATWQGAPLAQLSFTQTDCMCSLFNFNPAIVAVGATVHVVWTDEVFVPAANRAWSKIFITSSYDRGTTWQPRHLVSSMGPFDSWVAAIAAQGDGVVHVAWVDSRQPDGLEREYYRRSFDNGATFTEPEQELTVNAPAWAPSLAVSGNTVHLAFIDNGQASSPGGPWIIAYRRSLDGGTTWEREQAPTGLPGVDNSASDPEVLGRVSMAVSGSRVRLVWHVPTPSGSGSDVLYLRSDLAGAASSWSSPIGLATVSGHGRNPSVAIDPRGNSAHVIWEDTRGGAPQIYHRSDAP